MVLININYTNKEIQELDYSKVKGKTYIYTISDDDLQKIMEFELLKPESENVKLIMCKENSNLCDMLVENIDGGRILTAGVGDNKSLVQYYELEKGVDIVLEELFQKMQ